MQGGDGIKLERGMSPGQRDQVARLYWRHFGRQILPVRVSDRRGQDLLRRAIRADQVIVAQDHQGRLAGVLGLRDASGGMLTLEQDHLRVVFGGVRAALLWRVIPFYLAGPKTADMVIDGIVVAENWRQHGIGARLIALARQQALLDGYPGLRAEVAVQNHTALAFYSALGFSICGHCRMGWAWSRPSQSRVQIMRLAT